MLSNFEARHIQKAKLHLDKNLKIAKDIKEEEIIKSKGTLSWWQKIKDIFLG